MLRNIEIQGYQILEELGRGGMGRVFKAVQLSINRIVALKTLEQSLFLDEDAARRMVREARISGGLRHENLVKIHDAGHYRGTYYISMELLPGGDLADAIKRGLSAAGAVRYTLALAEALHFAHQQGFVHRDIKPENILLREDDTPVITDFGIAKPIDSQTRLTMTGAIIGTPQFMSPEQTKGLAVDGRSDLYSLASVLFYMLTGETLFKAESFLALTYQQVHQPIPKLVSPHHKLQWFFDKALAKQPEDRYQTGAEMKSALLKLHKQLVRLPQQKIQFKRALRASESAIKFPSKRLLYYSFMVTLLFSTGFGLWYVGVLPVPDLPVDQVTAAPEEQSAAADQSIVNENEKDSLKSGVSGDELKGAAEDESSKFPDNDIEVVTDTETHGLESVEGEQPNQQDNASSNPLESDPTAESLTPLLAKTQDLIESAGLDPAKIQQIVVNLAAARTIDPANARAAILLTQIQDRLQERFDQSIEANEYAIAKEQLAWLKQLDSQADQSGLLRELKDKQRNYQREQRELQKTARIAELIKDAQKHLLDSSLLSVELARNDYLEILALESDHPEGLKLREAFLQKVIARLEQALLVKNFEEATLWAELLAKEPQGRRRAETFKQEIASVSRQQRLQVGELKELVTQKSLLLGQIDQLLNQSNLTKERIQQAEAKISKLLKLDSNALSNSNQQQKLFDAYRYLAKRYLHDKDYDEAMRIVNLAITKQPTNTTLLALRQDIKKAQQRKRRNISSF